MSAGTTTLMPPLFEERQRFRQPWIWAVLYAEFACVVAILVIALHEQLVLHRPWGSHPVSDRALVSLVTGVLALELLVLALLASMELRVQVDPGVLRITFTPFVRRAIPAAEIASAAACTYRPLADYGGWGIRLGRSGRAYNVSGNRGVQLELRDGRRVLVGSQRPEELASALERARA